MAAAVCLPLTWWDAGAVLALAAGLLAVYEEFRAETGTQRRLALAAFVLAVLSLAVSMANGGLLGASVSA